MFTIMLHLYKYVFTIMLHPYNYIFSLKCVIFIYSKYPPFIIYITYTFNLQCSSLSALAKVMPFAVDINQHLRGRN
jgi:hypothetical protein